MTKENFSEAWLQVAHTSGEYLKGKGLQYGPGHPQESDGVNMYQAGVIIMMMAEEIRRLKQMPDYQP